MIFLLIFAVDLKTKGYDKRKDMTTLIIEDSSSQVKKFATYARILPFAKVERKSLT